MRGDAMQCLRVVAKASVGTSATRHATLRGHSGMVNFTPACGVLPLRGGVLILYFSGLLETGIIL